MNKNDIKELSSMLEELGFNYEYGVFTKGSIDISVNHDVVHEMAHPQNEGKGWYLLYHDHDHTKDKVIDVWGVTNPYFMALMNKNFAHDYLNAVLGV